LRKLDQRLGEMWGLDTFRFTVERVKNTARIILRDGPDAVRQAKVDAMPIDHADMGRNRRRLSEAALFVDLFLPSAH
jgi:zeaxanthin glucosyltransferase